MSNTSTSNTTSPAPNPTVVFVTKQAGYTVASLAMVAATVILALNHFIADGEIVTLLVTAVGAHVLASVNGTGTTTTDNSVNTPALPIGGTVPVAVQSVPVVATVPAPATTVPANTVVGYSAPGGN